MVRSISNSHSYKSVVAPDASLRTPEKVGPLVLEKVWALVLEKVGALVLWKVGALVLQKVGP